MVPFAMQKFFSLVRSYLLTVALSTASVLFRKFFPVPVNSTYFLLPPIKQNQGVCSYTEVFDPLGDFCVDVHMDLFSFFCGHHSVWKIPSVEDPVLYPVCFLNQKPGAHGYEELFRWLQFREQICLLLCQALQQFLLSMIVLDILNFGVSIWS